MKLSIQRLLIAISLAIQLAIIFVVAKPQSDSSSVTTPIPGCVTCPSGIPTCPPCKSDEICSTTAQSCEKCAKAICVSSKTTQAATASDDQASSSGSIVPIAIAGVCAGLVMATAIAGLVWYRQRRRREAEKQSQQTAITINDQYDGPASNYSQSMMSGNSNNQSYAATTDRGYSTYRPRTSTAIGYQTAAGATAALAEFAEVEIEGDRFTDVNASNSDMHLSNTSHSNSGASPSVIYSPTLNTSGMGLGSVMAAATQSPGFSQTSQIDPNSSIHQPISAAQHFKGGTRDLRPVSMADSMQSDVSVPIQTAIVRKATLKSVRSPVVVKNFEDYSADDGRVSRADSTIRHNTIYVDGDSEADQLAETTARGALDAQLNANGKLDRSSHVTQPINNEAGGGGGSWDRSSFARQVFGDDADNERTNSMAYSDMGAVPGDGGCRNTMVQEPIAEEDPSALDGNVSNLSGTRSMVDVTVRLPENSDSNTTAELASPGNDAGQGYWEWRQEALGNDESR